jgi:hypothetical protein
MVVSLVLGYRFRVEILGYSKEFSGAVGKLEPEHGATFRFKCPRDELGGPLPTRWFERGIVKGLDERRENFLFHR